ncbi:MAG: hypothetical protein ACRDJ2_07955 [Actinomycetota bacterium]
MDTSRVSLGEMIAAAGGLVLLVCMFLPWFGGERVGRGGALVAVPTTTGWEGFSGVFDLLIVVLVAVPIGITVARANDAYVRLPVEQWFAVMAAGAVLLLLVVVRLIDPPDVLNVSVPGLEIDVSRKLAGFVAAAAAAAIIIGGYLQSMRRVGFEPTSP